MIATVHGDCFDYMMIDKLKRRIGTHAALPSKNNIILDLAQVGYVPSTTLGALVKLLDELRKGGRRFILVGMNKHVRSSFKHMRFDILFEVLETKDDAIKVLRSREWS